MYRQVKIIRKFIFYGTLLFLLLAYFRLLLAQELSFKLKRQEMVNDFYNIPMRGMPISILCTVFSR